MREGERIWSYDHRSYVERTIVIRSRAYCFEGLSPHVRCRQDSAIGDSTYLLPVITDLVLVQRREVFLNCRIGACSVVHKDLQRRKLAIIVRSVIATNTSHPREVSVKHVTATRRSKGWEGNKTDVLARNSRGQRNRATCEPIDVRLGPIDETRINRAGPSWRLSRAEDEHGIDDLHHALEVDHAHKSAHARGLSRPTHHLAVVQIRVHVRIFRDEPRVDPACNVRGVFGRTVDCPGERVVEDGVGHGHECARVVDREGVRVELAIASVVRTCSPNCARKKGVGTCEAEAIM
jgi:hypothetical protein